MKKLILILSLITGISAATFAHGDKSPQKRAEHITKKLKEKLNLTADQTIQVSAIMLNRATRMDSLKTNRSATDKKLNHSAVKNIMMATDQKLTAVLNPDQQKAYETWKEARKEKHRGKKDSDEKTK